MSTATSADSQRHQPDSCHYCVSTYLSIIIRTDDTVHVHCIVYPQQYRLLFWVHTLFYRLCLNVIIQIAFKVQVHCIIVSTVVYYSMSTLSSASLPQRHHPDSFQGSSALYYCVHSSILFYVHALFRQFASTSSSR